MNSHPFDTFAESLARGVSRRDVLRMMFRLAAGVVAYPLLPKPGPAMARVGMQQNPNEPQPPGYWPPDFPLGVGCQTDVRICAAQDARALRPRGARAIHLPPKVGSPLTLF